MNIEREIQDLRVELYGRGRIPCALLGRAVRDTECSSRGLTTTVEEFQVCRACPQGHALAATSPFSPRNLLPMAPWPVFAGAPAPRPLLFPTRPASSKAEPAAPRRWIWFDETMPWPPRPTPQAKPAPRPEAPHPMMAMQEGQTAQQAKLQATPKPARQPKLKAPRPERPAKPVAKCRECGWLKPRRCTWPEPDLCSACAPEAKPVRPKHLDKRVITTAPVAPPAPQPADPRLEKLISVLRELTADGRMRVSMLDLMRSLGASSFDEAHSLVLYAGLRTSQLYGPVQSVIVDHNVRALLGDAASGVSQ